MARLMRLKQRGYLLIVAAVLIAAVSVFALSTTHVFTSLIRVSSQFSNSSKALYIAEGGIDHVLQVLINPTAGSRIECAELTSSNPAYTNISLGGGRYSVTGVLYHPDPYAKLASAVNSTQTTIPLTFITGYAANGGRVYIDEEVLDYQSVSTNSSICGGNNACLVGVTRGVDGTTASNHTANTYAVQHQCNVTAEGGYPDLSNSSEKRKVEVWLSGVDDGWAVGESTTGEMIIYWSGAKWYREGPLATVPDVRLNDIDIVSLTDGWIVGNAKDGRAAAVHWDGTTWSATTTMTENLPNKNLFGVDCVDETDAWAVGEDATFVHWNGTTWLPVSAANIINVPATAQMNAVSCTASNDCWAVGNNSSGALFVRWNGTQWIRSTPDASVPSVDMNGVSCLASDDCWAVGDREAQNKKAVITHWNGTIWSRDVTSAIPDNDDLNAIACPDATHCWAVGNSSSASSPAGKSRALFMRWISGTGWSRVYANDTTYPNGVPDQNLEGISCFSNGNCWAVGKSKLVVSWNGTEWTVVPTSDPNIPLKDLHGVSVLNTGIPHIVKWREIYP